MSRGKAWTAFADELEEFIAARGVKGEIQPSLRESERFFNLIQHFVLGYFQPSAFGGLDLRLRP
jgi:hypothetical protein